MQENKQLIADINRRNLLRGTRQPRRADHADRLHASATRAPMQTFMRAINAFNDDVQELIFRPNHLAPTYSEDQVVEAAALQRLLRRRGRQTGRRQDLEAGAGRPASRTRQPWTVEQIYRLPETGTDHPAHLRRGLGLYRPVVGRELDVIPQAHRRRHHGQIHRVQMRRRLYRNASTWRRRCIRRPSWRPNTPASRSPTRSAFRCACAPRPSSASRTPNGSWRWR